MKKTLTLLAGLSLAAVTVFATETTTRPAVEPKIVTNQKTTTGAVEIHKEFTTTKGAVVKVDYERTSEGAVDFEREKVTTKGSIIKVDYEKTTDGAVTYEKTKTTSDGAVKPEKPEGVKTTGGAIGHEKGKAYGHQREKNPIAEMNINKVKPSELTDEEKAALKAKHEEIKAAKEKEEGKEGKKGKFGKGKK